jgi:hypothetical protein
MVALMKSLRVLGSAALTLLLAFAISACQKSAQTDMSQASDTTQVSQGYGNESTPPAQTGPEATTSSKTTTTKTTTTKTTTTRSHSGTGSSSEHSTSASYAEKHTMDIPAGTTFDIEMVTPVDTRTSNVGDKVEGKLLAPITLNGTVLAEAGSQVSGEVSDVQRASRHKGSDDRASLALEFNSIDTVDGPKTLHATVNNAEGKMVAKGTGTRDKLIIGGSTVAGAILGKVAGGDTKSTIIGAVGGAAAGTGAMLMVKGHELSIEQGAKVSLRVDKPITVVSR